MDTNEQVLKLLDASLHNRRVQAMPAETWHAVHAELQSQTAACIPVPKMDELGLNADDRREYMSEIGANLKWFHILMREQQKVTELLENAGIPVAVLKGAAAAMYYPYPEYRSIGDIDIIVHRQDFRRAFDVLSGSGFMFNQEPDDYYWHITFKSSAEVHIELHDRFSAGNDEARNAALDRVIDDGIEHRTYAEVCRYRVPVLPELANGIVLLAHINMHLPDGIGLRQILDWVCYVEKHTDEALWASFETAAGEIGMKRLAAAVTAMCKKYLGLSCGIGWLSGTDGDEIADELMEYIMNHGNFGRKDIEAKDSVHFFRMLGGPVRALKLAQKFGQRTWKALERYPWLKPFAWVYQLIRWLNHGRERGIDIPAMGGYAGKERKETDLLRRLGVTAIPKDTAK